MSRQQSRAMMEMEGLIPKIRKRGCSTSSSSSSKVHSYRFKRTILVGKKARGGIGLGGSRSSTPVPTWKMTPLRGAIDSPKYSQKSNNGGGRSGPVSARRLAATLWEMNEIPSPRLSENLGEKKKNKNLLLLKKEKLRSSVPSHLSDPSHSPVSERMDRSATGSYQRRSSSTSQRLNPTDHNARVFDSISSASLMEIETRSRAQTPSGSVASVRNRLKDVSNALTTSKELLKILNRVWATADQPSSSMSLVSALHAELERARLQVNQLIQEQRSDQNEINYLMKCLAEEKAAWKNKERQAVEAAIDTIAGELEVERKLRRRFESLNKKLGKELAETKASFMKVVKELESEKRAREVVEQVCDELARDMGEDKVVAEELKRDSEKVREEVEKEREMLHLADMLREERVQMKLSEAKHQFEEKNTAVDKLRKQLEAFLGRKKSKEKRSGSHNLVTNDDISASLSKSQFSTHPSQEKEDDGEVEDAAYAEEDSAESELHSIELSNSNGRAYKWPHGSYLGRESRRTSVDDEIKGRYSNGGQQVPRKSSSLQRSISEGVECGIQPRSLQNTVEVLDVERISEMDKQAQRKSSADETHRNKAVKGLREHLMSSSRTGSARDFSSPTRQWEHPWPSRDPCTIVQERSSGSKSRLGETRGEGQSARRSKW
ncbi:hypothetical protein M9H77_14765 [Catharanthus roseus]|uniref:Uncharacterized protein n=1 Tax=Catharanthus roseus TaxID=4058 RepID=A0ACC0BNZ5_CATRO|nr:hypothetical protein M9H77_14765 [Catharanthus roseus]